MIRTRTGFALLALGMVLFTIHGSLVPYQFISRDWPDVQASFEQALFADRTISKSDVLANWLLGVPLGFALLGLVRVDQVGFFKTLVWAVAFFPFCMLLSFSVEFAQLYCPDRLCARSDIIAQGVGVLTGYTVWILLGQWLTDQVRTWASHPRSGGRAGQLVLVYFGFLLVLQILPADLTISPKVLYYRFRDGEITLLPFRDWAEDTHFPRRMLESGVHLLLCLPLGYGLRTWPELNPGGRRLLVAVLLCTLLETAQVFVQSRHPSTTEAISGFVGILLGSELPTKSAETSSG